jgi:SAM-dependent methyltransferase
MPSLRAIDLCPTCGSQKTYVFYEVHNIPIHSVLLMPTRDVALNYPKGDMALAFCQQCGFIFNRAFKPGMHEYSSSYEETQGFSPTFRGFHERLARQLIERYELCGKSVIEIGCGKGEFLTLLCELGEIRAIGFDPAYVSDRVSTEVESRVTFIKDFYSEKYTSHRADFVCCKMTLEHIQPTADFIRTLRNSVGDRLDTIVFFQVPDVVRILRDVAFWDIYYEHCSYFSAGSLARLFRRCGFEVTDLWKDYGDQYLMIEARPTNGHTGFPLPQENDLNELADYVKAFSENYQHKLNAWKQEIERIRQTKQKVVVWGGGSKGVTFLTGLHIQTEIEYVVDIDPYKHGTYMAGTGQKIVAPNFLHEYRPDGVIIMNSIYHEEIRQQLRQMGLSPQITAI